MNPPTQLESRKDPHSWANADEMRSRHLALDVHVSFEKRSLEGTATLSLDRLSADATKLILDTRDLTIHRVETSGDDSLFTEATFEVGESDPILGAPLVITVPPEATEVRVHYATAPNASALQWLEPAQTAGKRRPFLYTQSQAIHARSWIPLQDTPGVRVTYQATVRTPPDLLAVMGAERHAGDGESTVEGVHRFEMKQPIPSYLFALAVGDVVFQPISDRTGVYAEPAVLAQAVREFEDVEQMMRATETLYGPYRWGRYDILVLPPAFPFGGMENPRLTFATPTILAGDKSLVSLVAHELAHSWSGNLVTNATWGDFWLNEGFTVYLENRIQEEIFGHARAEMEVMLEVQELKKEMATLEPRDQILHIDLAGRDPDAAVTPVAYIKGMLFLRRLEELVGRERFDVFLRTYFDRFAFQSITTADFLDYLQHSLLSDHPKAAGQLDVSEWINQPGLPDDTPRPTSDALRKVETHAQRWLDGRNPASSLPAGNWTTQEWLHFLRSIPDKVEAEKLHELDNVFQLTRSGNAEIAHQWLLMSVRNEYEPAYPRLEEFLTSVGRRKFLKPLYGELSKTPRGRERARAIYKRARRSYHPISVATVDEILGWSED